MAITKVTEGARTLGTGEVTTANMATDPTNASNLSSGSVPLAQLGNVDTTAIVANQDDIALLGFKVAANGSLARYNLVDQSIDAFEDASGVDASASTGEERNASNYYSGETASTGGTSSTYSTYTLSTFTATGTFTAGQSGLADILVLAGGGQGGQTEGGGGGGAGGFKYWSQTTVASGANTVTIGDGGSSGTGSDAGEKGGDSQFASLSASEGGGGGGLHRSAGLAGGSGGGGSGRSTAAGGAGSANQGNDGGAASSLGGGTDDAGGGGGGASAVGANASGTTAGNGGAGYTEGATVYDWEAASGTVTLPASFYNGSTNSSYTGGGGAGSETGSGGSGGTGGGGAADTNATVNTGGGGGGNMAGEGSAGDGGSGIVIIRYTTGALDSFSNMTLISNAITAEGSAPTKGDLVITYTNGIGTATIGTDLKVYISRDGSAYTSSIALTDVGDSGGHTILTAHDVDLTGITSGTSMRWKIETLNQSGSKATRIQAVSLGWS